MEGNRRIALLAGASGLTGGLLLRRLLAAPEYARVHAATRRPLPLDHPKLANHILPLEQLAERLKGFRCDDAFCCLGTTLREAGSIDAQRRIDVDLVLRFAEVARAAGATRLVVLSSAGADPASRSPYLRLKGELESGLRTVRVPEIHILRPGPIVGSRRVARPVERLTGLAVSAVNPLLRGRFAEYRSIPAAALADAMLGAALRARRGVTVHAGVELRALAAR